MRRACAILLALASSLTITGCGASGHASPDARPDAEGGADASTSSDAALDVSDLGDAGELGDASDLAETSEPGDSSDLGDAPAVSDAGDAADAEPSVSQNPPAPAGWKLMPQAEVTPEMTTWAVEILHDPITYPMFSSTMKVFGALTVLARVEWHPPDFQNGVVHRGVTLYEPN